MLQQSFDKSVPKPENDIKPVIDIRNTDKADLDENASNTLVIILTNYLKRIAIFKNAGSNFQTHRNEL